MQLRKLIDLSRRFYPAGKIYMHLSCDEKIKNGAIEMGKSTPINYTESVSLLIKIGSILYLLFLYMYN